MGESNSLSEIAATRVSEVAERNISVFRPGDAVSRVLGVLKETGLEEVLVGEEENLGVVTLRDLLDVDKPWSTKLNRVWRPVPVLQKNDTVLKAVDQMYQLSFTALPAKLDEGPAMVSQMGVVARLVNVHELLEVPAKELMVTRVATVEPDTTIAQARRIMLDGGFSHLPVVEEGRVVGMVKGRELVSTFLPDVGRTTFGERVGEKVARFSGRVEGFMDRDVYSVGPEETALAVARGMTERGVRYVLVLGEDGGLLGLITHWEMLQPFLDLLPKPELPIYIVGLEEEGDFFEREVVEAKVRRMLIRVLRMHRLDEARVTIESQRTSGAQTLYHVSALLRGPGNSYRVDNQDWGLMDAFDGLLEALDEKMRREKKEPQKGGRRGRRRRRPPRS